MRIVFCGRTFADATEVLRQCLPADAGDEVMVWAADRLETLPANIDVLIPKMHHIDRHLLAASQCRLVQQWGVGLEGVDIDAASALNIPVANVPAGGGNADSVAEHAILLILALLRQLPRAQASAREGILGAPSGEMLSGRTVCLYGLGTIALQIAKRLRGFGVTLIGVTRDPAAPKVVDYGLQQCYSLEQSAIGFGRADILIICMRLSSETQDSIGTTQIANLRTGALLINVARGGIVEEQALLGGLLSGQLAGAGLDVFWREPLDTNHALLQLENVIATPHIAGITRYSLMDIGRSVADNINRLREGAPLLHIQNREFLM